MPQKIYLQKLLRLTLVRKGKGVAKHPELRSGVVEVVKASTPDDTESTWIDLTKPASPAHRARLGMYQ
jgi:hypothetical protein